MGICVFICLPGWSRTDAGRERAADRAFAVPPATDPDFAPVIGELCRAQEIALVVPTIDPELLPLSRLRDELLLQGC